MATKSARLTTVPTRLGKVLLSAHPVFGTPLEIPAEDTIVKVGRKVLHIVKGGPLISRRYGPQKRSVVMQVQKDVFAALRGLWGVSAYYGRPGHGALSRAQTIATRLHDDAEAAESCEKSDFLCALAHRFEEGVYARSRLLSRVEVWHNALLLMLDDDLQVLRQIRHIYDVFSSGETFDPAVLPALADGLLLAPFVGVQSKIRVLVGEGSEALVFSRAIDAGMFKDLADEIDGYLLRSQFEQLHCGFKAIERGMVDDAGRRLNPADGPFYGRLINALLPPLQAIGMRMPEAHQKEATASIVESLRSVYRALNTMGLTRETLDLFLKARRLMKVVSENLG